jgi:hypothetical protein
VLRGQRFIAGQPQSKFVGRNKRSALRRWAPARDSSAWGQRRWRDGEVDTILGFEKEADALQWIKEKSQGWLLENK